MFIGDVELGATYQLKGMWRAGKPVLVRVVGITLRTPNVEDSVVTIQLQIYSYVSVPKYAFQVKPFLLVAPDDTEASCP